MKGHIILVGGGGHCKACIDVIEESGDYDILGIIDSRDKIGSKVLGYSIIGADDDVPALLKECHNFLITVGQIKTAEVRRNIINEYSRLDMKINFPTIFSPHSIVSSHAEIGPGTIVMHGSIINAGARVGRHCILNTNSLVEHEAVVGDFCHISTGAILNGNVSLGSEVFIGSNAVINQGIKVPSAVTIGSASVVRKSDILVADEIFVGNPLKRLGENV